MLEGEFGEQSLTAWRIFEGIASEHETNKEMRGQRLATLKLESSKGETKSVTELMGEIANARSLSIPAGSIEERKLAHDLRRRVKLVKSVKYPGPTLSALNAHR